MPKKIKIPLEIVDIMEDGCHPFIVGRINDQPVRLLIDTGASKSVLDKTFVMSLDPKVELEQSEQLSTGFGAGNLPSEFVSKIKFELGELSIPQATFAVLDLHHVNETYSMIGLPVLQGVIGGNLLQEYFAVIDYKKCLLKLTQKKSRKSLQNPSVEV